MQDQQLLKQFTTSGAHEPFAELVRRYVDLVYASALRQVRDSEAAEDVTQKVFVLLAQKANKLSAQVVLAGWLLNTTRFIARTQIRDEVRRMKYEREASAMREQTVSSDWDQMSPQLDDALTEVPESNRLAIVLKFLQGKTSDEVGQMMGISTEAARKRVSRGLEELREIFRRRGITTSADALGAALSGCAIQSAPPGLAGTTSAAIAKGGIALAKPASVLVTGAKLKIIAACIVAAAIVGGTTTVALQVASQNHSKPPITTPRTIAMADLPGSAAPQPQAITGTIRDTNGNPVSGAQIFLGYEGHEVYPQGGRQTPQATTSADGKFAVPAHAPPYAIVASTADGYAQVSWKKLETSTDITLQPWGKIQGILKVGTEPKPGEQIHLWRMQMNDDPWARLVHHETTTTTDSAGHFMFNRVAPGETSVYREVRAHYFLSQQWRYVLVEPGKAMNVNIGGEGRALVGRVNVPDDAKALVDWTNSGTHTYMAEIRRQDIGAPLQHRPGETPEQFTAAEEAWGKTDAGKLYKRWMFENAFVANTDGTFRVDDIPPGKYSFSFRFLETDKAVNFSEDVASVETTIEVPSAPSPSNAPLDVGALQVVVRKYRLRPGQPAPDFSATTLDGSSWKMADQLSRPVVLIFWQAYNDNRAQEMQEFSAFAQRWAQDERVAILGVFVAAQLGDAKKLIQKYNLNFPQTDQGQTLMGLYDSSCPEAVLIGIDGKVIEKHLNGELLQDYLIREVAKEK